MQEHEDSLTRSIIKDAEKIGTDYRCLSRDEKLILSTIYFYGTHGRCFVTINTIIDVMSNIWNPTIYLNKETHRRYIKRIINGLRYKGFPILTFYGDKPGYTWPTEPEQLEDYKERMVKSIRKRFGVVNRVIKSGNKLLNAEIEQLKLYEE